MIGLFQFFVNDTVIGGFKCLLCRTVKEIVHKRPDCKIVFTIMGIEGIVMFDICTSCNYEGKIIDEREYVSIMSDATPQKYDYEHYRINKHNFMIYVTTIRHRYETTKSILPTFFNKDEISIIMEYCKNGS
jgi:hypothetical protein